MGVEETQFHEIMVGSIVWDFSGEKWYRYFISFSFESESEHGQDNG